MIVEVQFATSRRGIPHPRRLHSWAESAYAIARTRASLPPTSRRSVAVRIVGAAEGRRLNRSWRGKNKPTNVLSFPAGEMPAGPDGSAPLGDIVICAPVIRREAREQGKVAEAHWAHMVVHGVLHLAGYDHEVERDARVMERMETWLLASLGFPDPYQPTDAAQR